MIESIGKKVSYPVIPSDDAQKAATLIVELLKSHYLKLFK